MISFSGIVIRYNILAKEDVPTVTGVLGTVEAGSEGFVGMKNFLEIVFLSGFIAFSGLDFHLASSNFIREGLIVLLGSLHFVLELLDFSGK